MEFEAGRHGMEAVTISYLPAANATQSPFEVRILRWRIDTTPLMGDEQQKVEPKQAYKYVDDKTKKEIGDWLNGNA